MGIKVVAFDLFGTIFDLAGIPREELRAYAAHILKPEWSPIEFPASWNNLPVFPDAKEGLELLAKDYTVMTFSNCPGVLQSNLIKRHGLTFDNVMLLSTYKVFKPSQRAYECLVDEVSYFLGVDDPAEVLVVSANEHFGDIEGARAAGMQSLLIRHGRPNDLIELADYLKQMS